MGWASRAETHRLELRLNGGNVSRLGGGGVERTGVARGKAEQVQGGCVAGKRDTKRWNRQRTTHTVGGDGTRRAGRIGGVFGASLRAVTHRVGVSLFADGRAGDEGALREEGDGGRTTGQRCGVFSWNAMGTRLGGNTGRWARRRSAVARVVERIHAPSTRRRHPRRSAAAWPPARTGPRGRWRWCEASSRARVSASSDAEEPPEARERAENRR